MELGKAYKTEPLERIGSAGTRARSYGGWRRARGKPAWVGIAVALASLAIRFLLLSHAGPLAASADTCTAKGIDTVGGREGTCVAFDPDFGGWTVFNVVDSGHTLKMPGYDAALLSSSISGTNVIGALAGSPDYPDRKGLLISLELSITNTATTPLEFDQGALDVDLTLAPADGPGAPLAWHQIPYPDRGPSPQLDQQGALPIHGTTEGWVSFVLPLWAEARLRTPGSDLEFFRPGHEAQGYVGQIRLWKTANQAGLTATSFQSDR